MAGSFDIRGMTPARHTKADPWRVDGSPPASITFPLASLSDDPRSAAHVFRHKSAVWRRAGSRNWPTRAAPGLLRQQQAASG